MQLIPFDVYVFGNVEIYEQYFQAIATIIKEPGFNSAIHLAVLIGGVGALFRMMFKRDIMELVRWLGIFYLVMFICLRPAARVHIEDRTFTGATPFKDIDNVPLGLAIVAHYSSTIGAGLTEAVERVFHGPDDHSYNKTGLVMASRMVAAASQFQISDPTFNHNMQNFMQQCVFYDLFLHQYTVDQLLNEPNVWQFISGKTSKARAFPYQIKGSKESSQKIKTCIEAAGQMKNDWEAEKQTAIKRYGAYFFPGDDGSLFKKYLPGSYKQLQVAAGNAEDIIMQQMMSNALQQGVQHMAAASNASAALESFVEAKSKLQQRMSYQSIGEQAAYWLPLLKNTLEMIMYGMFLLVILLAFLPSGISILKNYALGLLWIQAWAPIYAIINYAVTSYAQAKSKAVVGAHLTLANLDALASVNIDMAALAGYLTMSVPFLAAGLVKGMVSVLNQSAQYVGGTLQTVTSGVAGEAVVGNISMGNTSFNTHQAYNTTANHTDTSGQFMAGGMSYQLPGGSIATVSPNGAQSINMGPSLSNLGFTLDVASNTSTALTQQAQKSYEAGLNYQKSVGDSWASAYRNATDLTNLIGKAKNSGNTSSFNQNDSVVESLAKNYDLAEQWGRSHNMVGSDATAFLNSVSANFGAGVSLGLGGGKGKKDTPFGISAGAGWNREASRGNSVTESALENSAKDYIEKSGYATNLQTAMSAIHDHHFSTNNEEAKHLSDSIGASMDQAHQFQQQATSSFQAAQRYSTEASMTQSNSATINDQATQAFTNYLLHGGAAGAGGQNYSAEDIEHMRQHDPAKMRELAQNFISGYAENTLHSQNWNHGMAASESDIRQLNQQNDSSIAGKETVANDYRHNQQALANSAHQQGLKENIVNNLAEAQADVLSRSTKSDIESEYKQLNVDSQKLRSGQEAEIKRAKDELSKIGK